MENKLTKQEIKDFLNQDIRVSEIAEDYEEISPLELLKHFISEDAQEDLEHDLLDK